MSHGDKYPGSPERTRERYLPKLAASKPWIRTSPAPWLILKNAKVVDPATSTLLPGLHTVVTKDGHVSAVVPDEYAYEFSQEEETVPPIEVDLAGKFVCPGLVDCHVHITATPGSKSLAELARERQEAVWFRSTYALREMLLRGFTTVRDTGGATKTLADAVSEGLIVGPRVVQCGRGLSQTGGHGDIGSTCCGGGHGHMIGRVCDGVPDVLKAVREELRGGADFIKIHCGGGVASPTVTTAHAYTDTAVLHAINNGVTAIEHGNLISESTAQMQKGIFLTPTLSCYGIMVRPPFEDYLPPEGKAKNEQVMAKGLDALKVADKAGVVICYGSDLLNNLQALQTEEFTVRAAALPAAKVLQHATTNASKLLRDSRLGTVSPGSYADMLILDANPLEDVRILDYPEDHLLAVIKGGVVFSSRVEGLPVQGVY
ncbi:uncharacterized protein B0H18DRAFT_1086650 [Fomitopsis serialis]|uniref:uncharacterized protein n=1 Tax=Fomitopsis serialis TaxID=139415 RepID=UPI0020085623|nr:uncharacterized protein B0H18DRAFT_1086650 [Neoantrodia serialis]KAH9919376.1 hypothetical protein B0H18DRAFT_1086650 [Neoantrodia serialis]